LVRREFRVVPGGDRESRRTLQGTRLRFIPVTRMRPWTELARLLASLAPRPLTTCFRATGGSEAVDLALQAAMIHSGRRAFLSLEGSYHGNTLAGFGIRQFVAYFETSVGRALPDFDRWRIHNQEVVCE
jgi:4-aminobutyrate aminotransferase-like enzyme